MFTSPLSEDIGTIFAGFFFYLNTRPDNMKYILLWANLVLVTSIAFAQSTIGLKVYHNTDIYKTVYKASGGDPQTTDDHFNVNRFSLAVDVRTKKGIVHELELFVPEFAKTTDRLQYPMKYELLWQGNFKEEGNTYSFRYELSKDVFRMSDKFTFNLGLGINPYYVDVDYIAQLENMYSRSYKFYGGVFNIVPRLNFKLSNHLTVDLNVPVKVYDLRYSESRVHNPYLPIRQQTSYDTRHIFLEGSYTIRLGLLYNFKS